MTKQKKWLITGVIIVIAVGVVVKNVFFPANKKPQYQTVKVERGTIVSTVSASGKVLSANAVSLNTVASGIVKKVYVDDGENILIGEKIAELELDSLGKQKNSQAWSAYLSAKNNVETAKAGLYTLQSQMFAVNQKLINDAVARNLAVDDPTYIQENADWLAAETKYKNQQSVITADNSSLLSAWLDYQQSAPIITAPIAGKLTSAGLFEGMVLDGSSQKIAVIKNDSAPLLSFDVSEVDIAKVKIDQKVTVTVDSLTGKTFTGKVIAVNRVGVLSSNVTNYPVIVKLDISVEGLLPNMAAEANIILDVKNDVLIIPSLAIQTVGDQTQVKILKNGREQQVNVTLGLASDTDTEVVSGVSESDTIILGNVTPVSTGSTTRSVFGGNVGPFRGR